MRNAQTPYLMAVTTTTARAPGGTTSGRSDHVIWRPDDGTGGSREPTAQRPIRDLTILWAGLSSGSLHSVPPIAGTGNHGNHVSEGQLRRPRMYDL